MLHLITCALLCLHPLVTADQPFKEGHEVSYIKTSEIDQASGLAASRKHKGILYTVNDHSPDRDENRVFAIDANTGNLVATFQLTGVTNHDWEDIAVGPCWNDTCVYIGDTGRHYTPPANKIYRFREPEKLREHTISIDTNDTLSFSWDEPESECLMTDDLGNLFIVSRVRYGHALIAALPNDWGEAAVKIENVTRIHLATAHYDPRGCDISPDGKGMLIKAEVHMYYWQVPDRDYLKAAEKVPTIVPYHQDTSIANGQSVAWAADGQGYYTLPENRFPNLYFYPMRYIVIGG